MPNTTTAQPVRRGRFGLICCIATFLIALIFLTGLAVLITWLVVKPKDLEYTIEDGSIYNFTLINNHLNASFAFVIRAHNPNRRISIYYDYTEVSITFNHQTIGFTTLESFHQPHKNVTILKPNIVARDASLSQRSNKELRLNRASGNVELLVKLRARIRYKVIGLKLRHQTLKVTCSPVLHFYKSQGFETAYCDTDL